MHRLEEYVLLERIQGPMIVSMYPSASTVLYIELTAAGRKAGFLCVIKL